MSEVHSVYATVRRPRDANDLGQVTTGYYTFADDLLTMTDSKGVAVRATQTGEKYVRKIKPGEDARAIASRLTLEIYRMLRARRQSRQRDSVGRSTIRRREWPKEPRQRAR